MTSDPLDTTDYEVPTDPAAVASALRDMADGDEDYLGRLLMVAALHVDAFSRSYAASDAGHLAEARRLARVGAR